MKKLVFTTLLSVLTIGSSLGATPARASTTTFNPIDPLTTSEETLPTQLDESVPNLSEAPQEQQLAYYYYYSDHCYYEIYPDGSYFWVCI